MLIDDFHYKIAPLSDFTTNTAIVNGCTINAETEYYYVGFIMSYDRSTMMTRVQPRLYDDDNIQTVKFKKFANTDYGVLALVYDDENPEITLQVQLTETSHEGRDDFTPKYYYSKYLKFFTNLQDAITYNHWLEDHVVFTEICSCCGRCKMEEK
mgnify:CR=1 FL=1